MVYLRLDADELGAYAYTVTVTHDTQPPRRRRSLTRPAVARASPLRRTPRRADPGGPGVWLCRRRPAGR